MLSFIARILIALALANLAAFPIRAQSASEAPAGPRVEPGLETAVRWIWRVEPSPAGSWGLALPDFPTPPPLVPQQLSANGMPAPRAAFVAPASGADSYTVKRGDALILIGRRFKVPVALLKEVNGLTTDRIRTGQVLRIP